MGKRWINFLFHRNLDRCPHNPLTNVDLLGSCQSVSPTSQIQIFQDMIQKLILPGIYQNSKRCVALPDNFFFWLLKIFMPCSPKVEIECTSSTSFQSVCRIRYRWSGCIDSECVSTDNDCWGLSHVVVVVVVLFLFDFFFVRILIGTHCVYRKCLYLG